MARSGSYTWLWAGKYQFCCLNRHGNHTPCTAMNSFKEGDRTASYLSFSLCFESESVRCPEWKLFTPSWHWEVLAITGAGAEVDVRRQGPEKGMLSPAALAIWIISWWPKIRREKNHSTALKKKKKKNIILKNAVPGKTPLLCYFESSQYW